MTLKYSKFLSSKTEIHFRWLQSNTPSLAWEPQNKTSPSLHHYTWQMYRDMEWKFWSRWRLLVGFNHRPPYCLLLTGQKPIMDQNPCHHEKWWQIFATDGDRKLEYKHVVRIRWKEKGTKLSTMSENRLTAGQPRNCCSISGTGNRFKNLSVLQKKKKIPDRLWVSLSLSYAGYSQTVRRGAFKTLLFLIVVLPCMLTITQLLFQQNAHFYY
jgi:hypothetical protein